jgi:L-amino acid N-acyltransferase YncA
MTVRLAALPLRPVHWPAVREIYAQGIASGHATFRTEPPEWEAFHAGHLPLCRWVAAEGEAVLGWAALSPVSSRCVYAGVAEVSVYVAARARGRGVGDLLLRTLVASSEAAGLWTLQAGIFPENAPSVALHRKHGFREVGVRERLGRMGDRWRDVLLMERRSALVGGEAAEGGAGGPRPLPEPLRTFAELLNRGDAWDSHEVLEAPWREEGSRFYQGLILLASAEVHLQRANPRGAEAQLRKAEEALTPFGPAYLGVDVAAVLDGAADIRRALEKGGEGGASPADTAFPSLKPLVLDSRRVRGDEPELARGTAP